MMVLPFPTRWPVPRIGRVPPIITVGSIRAAMAMWVHIEVVDVLPWVPEMHRAFSYRRIMDPQAWARSNTGMPRAWAAAISGLSSWTAAVRITRSLPSTLSPRWPMTTGMPRERRWSTAGLSFISEPVMIRPSPWSTSAKGDMDTPPIPTKCARFPGTM